MCSDQRQKMNFLRIQRLSLNSIGYSLKKDESLLRRMYSLFGWMSILIITIPEIHFVIENITDIPLATDAMCTILTCILSLSKVMTMYFKKDKFYHVIEQLDNMWMESSASDRIILEKGHQIDKRITLSYLISSVAVAVLYLLFPIVKGIYELRTIGTAVWIMPMRSIFMYDILVSPNYEITYLWFVQCTYLAAIGSVGIDCLFYGSAFNISAHFQIIQQKIRNMAFGRVVVQHELRTGTSVVTEEFVDIIKYHQKVLDICEKFGNLYSAVLFMQFMVTSVQLCVIAFQLTLPNQQLMMMVIFGLFLSAICFQLFTYCHAGSQLTAESVAIAEAIYDSCWYKATPSIKKSVAFVLMRSQKSVVISSGFYVASLETFKAILSAAGSYIAILQSISEDIQ